MPESQQQKRLNMMIEDVDILRGGWRNFSGNKTPYNEAGKRNFVFLLPKSYDVDAMVRDGWNVKLTKEREIDEETVGGEPFLKVSLNYNGRPPKVVMVTSRGRNFLGENQVGMLDWADIKHADVKVNGRFWEVNGKWVCSAYLDTLYVTIEEDYLDQKYGDIPMAGEDAHEEEHEEPNGE